MMNDVLPPSGATTLSNSNKPDHSNSLGGPGHNQQLGSASVGGPTNSNFSGPFNSGGTGSGAGVGSRVSNTGGPTGQPAALDRLNRRVSGYRQRQNDHLPKYNNTMHSMNNQHSGETVLLRQKFLESTKNKKVGRHAIYQNYKDCQNLLGV